MAGMTECDFSEADSFFGEIRDAVEVTCEEVGRKAVEYAKENGTYHDVTGRLRRSNRYEASPDGLFIENTAPYAESVEAMGMDVISGAALYAERLLQEKCQRQE